MNEKIKKCEKLLSEKDKLLFANSGQEIYQKKLLEKKIEESLDELFSDLKNLSIELKAQKKMRTKEEILNLLKKKLQIMRYRFDDIEVKDEEIQENKTELEKLEKYLEQRKNTKNNYVDRELYQEEIDKMNEWDNRIKKQDEGLEEVHKDVKNLKYELEMAEEGIDIIQKKVKKTSKKANKSHKKVITQTQKIKNLTNKIRSSDKFCCDVILIFILLGLIGVLVAVIRQKY